jgi:hypothetical protein
MVGLLVCGAREARAANGGVDVQHANTDIDRTTKITAVSEPATLSLVGLGAAALARRLKRRLRPKA